MLRFEELEGISEASTSEVHFFFQKEKSGAMKRAKCSRMNDTLSMLQASCLAELFANSFNPERGRENSQLVSNPIFYKAVSSQEYPSSTSTAIGNYSLSELPGFPVQPSQLSIVLNLPFLMWALFFCQK